MSNFYNSRPYVGSIAKKPRLGPRGPHIPTGQSHGDEDGKRLQSFKEFILSQSNDINEQEALTRYSEYKTEFTRRQIDKFFKEHQEEEWFRNKYRPIELKKFQEISKECKLKRKDLYNSFMERKLLDEPVVNYSQAEQITKFLDTFSLLLEGATLDNVLSEEAKNYSVSSIFLPSLHPSIDKSMIEEYASTHEGFIRVAMSEAQPNNGYRRRAWVTYKQMDQDSLRKLVWDYNAHKFNGQETKAMINKEMTSRIRYGPFWFCHQDCAKSDLKNVAKLLTHFEGQDCPLLESIKDYLIEETNEEEKVLGVDQDDGNFFKFEENKELFKALDKVILYLRVVHSFDYYVATEYSAEDDMPQKVGPMYARSIITPTPGENPREVLQEFIEAHKARIDSFVEKPTLSDIEQKQLGARNVDEEVENFIYQHTFEKKPGEKYICKLTKKRFTAPEFVRKHIFNRCSDKLDEVRTEVEYLNNYIADPKRPM